MNATTVPTAILEMLCDAVHDRLVDDGVDLAGRCEGAAGDLADALAREGHDVLLAWGEYDHPCPQGYPTTGHCWVVAGDMIADPTRAQFDDGPRVCAIGHSDAARYILHHVVARSELD